jgi:hypothetical protein
MLEEEKRLAKGTVLKWTPNGFGVLGCPCGNVGLVSFHYSAWWERGAAHFSTMFGRAALGAGAAGDGYLSAFGAGAGLGSIVIGSCGWTGAGCSA